MESKRFVRPVSPVVAYIGGKRKLTPQILPWIEAVPHGSYIEPFVGMGGVFLGRREAARLEVINDWSRDVSTFFRVLQRHYVPFTEMLRFQVTSRAEFERLAATDPATLTDLERSARFLYLQSCAFGGKPAGRSFGLSRQNFHGFDLTRVAPLLEAVHDRLAGVVIEALPYHECIARYDHPDALFYLDPPYYESEADYGRDLFERADFTRIADQLAGLQGRFILSINDHPEVRRIFGAFAFEEVATTYTIARSESKAVAELIFVGPPGRVWSKTRTQAELWS
ncbi:DNA adenine methylase [Azospirillum brasilense]|uniref:DNA adenine methylase n=1 Tax=Azospirillum argentinense TaxID=2970906 RepID=UPI00190A6057|nr:DNA adenine methylase [Azospirillum argentinense]MBK3798626.1 DNA adenine methylase [Azospirillum argentinense]